MKTDRIFVLLLVVMLPMSGCFDDGVGDAEAAGSNAEINNSAPEISLSQPYPEVICTFTSTCTVEIYHATVDPDGDLMTKGWDYDLDGTIDYPVSENRGYSTLELNISIFQIDGNNAFTTIAFISTDSNHASSARLTYIDTDEFSSGTSGWAFQQDGTYSRLTDGGSDQLATLEMTEGPSLSVNSLRISIVVDDGASYLCDYDGEYSSDCVFEIYHESDNSLFSYGEKIIISEGQNVDLCDGSNGYCEIEVTIIEVSGPPASERLIIEYDAVINAN